jgi:hypothetical protein
LNNDKIYNIIQSGENKDYRLYCKLKCNSKQILCSELNLLFKNLIKNDINLYYLDVIPTHKASLNESDIKFMKKNEDRFIELEFNSYPENLKKIKDLQVSDF